MGEIFTRLTDKRVVWIRSDSPKAPPVVKVFKDGSLVTGEGAIFSGANLLSGTPLSKAEIADLKSKEMPDQEE
jgi:hypothetical protein